MAFNLGKRKCQCGCKQPATQTNGVTAWASYECAMKIAQQRQNKAAQNNAKRERKERREQKERLKTKRDWSNEIDRIFQEYCRYRDADDPCISCGRFCLPSGNESDGGHYISRANKALRWDERNCNKQCKYCNDRLKGNYAEYRKGMIAKYGIEVVEWLERTDHVVPRYTVSELIEIKAKYSRLTRELRKGK